VEEERFVKTFVNVLRWWPTLEEVIMLYPPAHNASVKR
jgi:hypothetical protein